MAVPVKDEAERIEACVLARVADAIVLVVNNTTDETAAIVREMAGSTTVPVEVNERVLAPRGEWQWSGRRC